MTDCTMRWPYWSVTQHTILLAGYVTRIHYSIEGEEASRRETRSVNTAAAAGTEGEGGEGSLLQRDAAK